MDARIEEIMDNFNFEKVLEVMKFLNWEYRGEPVVSMTTIIMTALELLQDACYDLKDEAYRSTGGFTATKIDGELTLSFCIDKWSA